jgi:uncharacterized protein involved in outer membrane biogenesis
MEPDQGFQEIVGEGKGSWEMRRVLIYAGIILSVLVGLLSLAIVVVNLIPGNYYKSFIISKVGSKTGRELTIVGDLDIKLFTTFAFKMSGIKVSNAEWGSRSHMISVDNIEGELALFPLLRGILDLTLVVDKSDLLLETHSSGQGNWQFGELIKEATEVTKAAEEVAGAAQETESGGWLPLRPFIRKLHLNETHITFLDGKSGDRIIIQNEKLHVGSTEDKLSIELRGKFNDIPLAFSGGFDSADFIVANRPAKVNFDGHFGDAKLLAKGTIGPLEPTADIDVIVAVDTDSVSTISPLAGRDLPDIGPLSLSVRLTGKEGKYIASDLLTVLEDKNLTAEAKGSIADLAALNGLKLEAKVDTNHLSELLKIIGIQSEYLLPDSLNATAVVSGSLRDPAVEHFQTRIQGQGLIVNGNGEIKNIMTLKGVSANFSLETETLDLISDIAKTKLPPFGPLKATASIVSKGKNLDLMEIKADLTGKTIHADVAGSIGDPLKLKDVNVRVNLGVDSLVWLADYFQMELPPLGSLKATAKITSKGDTFEVKNIKADLAGDQIRAEIAGSVGDLLELKSINANVDVAIQSLAILSDIAKAELPLLGPLNVSANIASKADTFEIKDIKASLDDEKIQAQVLASVADALKLSGINANVDITVDSLASLGPLVKQKLPTSAPVKLKGTISSEGGLDGPIKIAAEMKSDGVKANLTGSVEEPLAAKGIDLALTLEAESIQQVGKLTGTQFQGKHPVKLEGKFSAGKNTYELAGLHLQVGDLNVTGQAAFKQPSESDARPQVSGEFHIGKLDLSRRQAKAGTSKEKKTEPTKEKRVDKVKKDKIFPSDPLSFGPLRSLDANIEVTIESFIIHELKIEDLVARLALDNGLLSIKPMKARVGNGNFDGTITLDTRNSPPTLIVDAELVDGTSLDFGGKIQFIADLNGRGDSIAAIMAGLNGQLKFNVSEATLKKSFMTRFGKSLLSSLNPLNSQKETTELICAIILFDIKDGIADANRKIAAQMTDVTWFGSGEINLKTEKIGFGVNPIPRKGLLHLGNYAKLVELGGTLAQPNLQIDTKGMAVNYGKYLTAVATGGLTWIAESLWSTRRANTDVCAEILKKLNTRDESKEKAE